MREIIFFFHFLLKVIFCLIVWSFLDCDVDPRKTKVNGTLVKCNGNRGKTKRMVCGNVLGIVEVHGRSKIVHLFNVRKTLGEKMPGPISSFKYNLDIFGPERPIPFPNKMVLKNLMKIPLNLIKQGSESIEYTTRTVICNGENVEIGYFHVIEHEPVVTADSPKPSVLSKLEPPKIPELGHSKIKEFATTMVCGQIS